MKNNNIRTHVLHSETLNPWFNLAMENLIFNGMKPEGHVLYLWRNSSTVVIGRYQNPWLECHLDRMEEDGVKLARRQSGGGAVYHDEKNLNFTFMSDNDDYSIERNFEIIIKALSKFGINAEVSGRNDILTAGRKISGSAFKLTKDRAFHHGTLLVDVDLERLTGYLNPDKRKLASKGIKSVKSRVANLTEFNKSINTDLLSDAVAKAFFKYLGSGDEDVLNLKSLENNPGLFEYYEQMKSLEWLYQKTPDFNHRIDKRFDWGGMEINLNVKNAVIEEAVIFSDCLYPEMIKMLTEKLKGVSYSRKSLITVLEIITKYNNRWTTYLEDIFGTIIREIV